MTCTKVPYRKLIMWTIFLAMLGMPLSLTVQRAEDKSPTALATQQKNVRIFPPAKNALGSLILLMGYSGDPAWTMTQWWFLDTAWSDKEREWCKDPPHSCIFNDDDKAAVQHLRNHLRVVDAVGKMKLAQKDGGGYAWYEYADWWNGAPNKNELELAIADVFQLIEQEKAIVGHYGLIALTGMSQGADLALEVGIRFPHRLAMVISQRGVLMPPRNQGNQTGVARPGTPFIMTCGDSDEFWGLPTFKASCVSLGALQIDTHFKSFPGVYHGSFSVPEWRLLIQSWSLMLSTDPSWSNHYHRIDQLEWWEACNA